MLVTNLDQCESISDFRVKEAIFHALGSLDDQIACSTELQTSIEPVLKKYVYGELNSQNHFMKARAIWLYGKFAKFPISSNDGHLRMVIEQIYGSLHSEHLPIKVEAALSITKLLYHEEAVEFIKPGLEQLLKTFLKIMDDIDFDELVISL